MSCCIWRFASLFLLLLLALGFLVSPLATKPHTRQENRNRLSTRFFLASPLSFFPLFFPWPSLILLFLPFRFVPCTCPISIGADVSGVVCRPRSSQVFLCQRPLSHVRTQGLVRLTICQGNHFQEVTVGCQCVFHHSRHLDRLLEVCTCGNSAPCNVFLPYHQGRLPRSTSCPTQRVGQEHLSRALLCDFSLGPHAIR